MCNASVRQVLDSLIYHRKLWCLSQRSLGFCLGWGINTVYRVETGKQDLTLPMLVQLMEFFKTDLETFIKPEWSHKITEWRGDK